MKLNVSMNKPSEHQIFMNIVQNFASLIMYKVIIFDLWNTIAFIKNIEVVNQRLREKIAPEKLKKLRLVFLEWHLSEFSEKQFLTRLQNMTTLNENEVQCVKAWLNHDKCQLYPETEEVLRYLKNQDKKLVLITNSPPKGKKQFQKLGLSSYFDRAIFSFEVGIMKPDPRIFQLAISDFNVDKFKILMVGDSLEKDIEGALDAGFEAILLDRDGKLDYKSKIHALSDLKGMIK